MIKKFVIICLLFVVAFSWAQTDKKTDLISVPGPIEFYNTEFFLDWVNRPSKTLYVQQYLPKDETYKEFNQFISISYFDREVDIEDAVKHKVEQINNRKDTDKFASVNVTESPDGKEFIVDFITTEKPEKGQPFAEYNFYRFKKFENGEAKSMIIFDYAKRIYGDLKSATKLLSKERSKILNNLAVYQLPEVKLASTPAK